MNPISQCINIEDELIATVDLDGIVQVWNISTAEEIMNLDCIPDRCSYICYVAASK
jgi:hypothetical protein